MKKRVLLAGIALFAFTACGGGGEKKDLAVPEVVGQRLDLAQSHLEDEGLEYEALGGGSLGIGEKWNWTVCQTDPPAGAIVGSKMKVKLVVDRICPGRTDSPAPSTPVDSTTPTTSPDAKIAMPYVIGKSLQSAQNVLQAAGLRHLKTRDTTGQNRQRIWDRNWVVTQQTPDAGTMVGDRHMIDLGAEKYTD